MKVHIPWIFFNNNYIRLFGEDKVAPTDEPSLNFDNNTNIVQNSDIVSLDKF